MPFLTLIWGLLKQIPGWLWIGFAVIAFIGVDHFVAYRHGYADAKTEWEAKLNEVVAQAQAEHDSQQSAVTARAEPENAELLAKFTEIKGQLDALKRLAPTKMPGKSAPVNCNADLARVQWVDEE